jgi:hypothetical protein
MIPFHAKRVGMSMLVIVPQRSGVWRLVLLLLSRILSIGTYSAPDNGSPPLSLVQWPEWDKLMCLFSRSVPWAITSPSVVGH